MRSITPGEIATRDLHQFLLGCVSPRPIAFASTISKDGVANLAPYSFFNAFSSNPPMVVFSSNRRVLDNTTKDTLRNIQDTGEVVINVVNHAIVRQMAVAAVEWPAEDSEFDQTGLTRMDSDMVAPFRVKESPAHLECKVSDIITLGDKGGAGHLILCDVVKMHVAESVIDERGRIDPHLIDLMGRMGRSYYVRASGDAVIPIVQPVTQACIGYAALPDIAKQSKILTGNDIGILAGLHEMPDDTHLAQALKALETSDYSAEQLARDYIENDDADMALAVLMCG